MANPTLIKSFVCLAAVAGRKLVTFGAADGQVATASAVSDPLIGVSEQIGSRDNQRVDVIVNGIAEVTAGGNITRGAALTSDASGNVVASAAGTDRIVGLAMQNAVAGDVIDVLIAQG